MLFCFRMENGTKSLNHLIDASSHGLHLSFNDDNVALTKSSCFDLNMKLDTLLTLLLKRESSNDEAENSST